MPENRGYRVILADPGWRFVNWSAGGEKKAPSAKYTCMSLDQLKALGGELGLDFICRADCVMVMWATFPMLPQAIELLAAWGFKYKSGGAWAKRTVHGKVAFGTGYIYRGAAELWLLGTRGNPKSRSNSERNVIHSDLDLAGVEGDLIDAKLREHSRKPDEMYDKIERQFDGPYLELFAREKRPGWDVWGDEVDKFAEGGG